MLPSILMALGAKVITVGRSEKFVPIDTENVTPDDQAYFKVLANQHPDAFAIVSTDGDSDRPFVVDEQGVFHRGDELVRIKDVELETEYEGITNYHRRLKARVTLENGETHTVEGMVKGFIPLRNRRQGSITHIGEGMTEYVLDGERVGYGLSEYLEQLE